MSTILWGSGCNNGHLCLLVDFALLLVSSVTRVSVQNVPLLHVSSSLYGGGRVAKEFVKISTWELHSNFYELEIEFFTSWFLFPSCIKLLCLRIKAQGSSNTCLRLHNKLSFALQCSAFFSTTCSCTLQFFAFLDCFLFFSQKCISLFS